MRAPSQINPCLSHYMYKGILRAERSLTDICPFVSSFDFHAANV